MVQELVDTTGATLLAVTRRVIARGFQSERAATRLGATERMFDQEERDGQFRTAHQANEHRSPEGRAAPRTERRAERRGPRAHFRRAATHRAADHGLSDQVVGLPKPPARELAAIAARAVAAGKKPTQTAILATYQRNQQRAAATPPKAPPNGQLKGSKAAQPNARAVERANSNASFKLPAPASSRGGRSGPGRGTLPTPARGGTQGPGRGGIPRPPSARAVAQAAMRERARSGLPTQATLDRISRAFGIQREGEGLAQVAAAAFEVGRYALPGSERQFLAEIIKKITASGSTASTNSRRLR